MELLWWHWVAFGMALMALEIFVPTFTLFWFGLGALIVGAMVYLTDPSVAAQVFIWAITSALFTLLWFKVINPRIADRSHSGMAREAIIGQVGMVLSAPTTAARGKVRFPLPLLGSDEWEFVCDAEVATGDRVVVVEVSGNTLVVVPGN